MTTTTETRIKSITPWVFSDANEKFSHLEMYFTGEGRNSYKGIHGARQQISKQLGLDGGDDLTVHLRSLIGKKVNITKDAQTGEITGVKLVQPVRRKFYNWFGSQKSKRVPEYC